MNDLSTRRPCWAPSRDLYGLWPRTGSIPHAQPDSSSPRATGTSAGRGRRQQEHQARHRTTWIPAPGAYCPGPKRISAAQDCTVTLHIPTLGSVLGQHQQARDGARLPALTATDRAGQPGLLIVLAQRRLDRRQFGLHFDDEDGGARWVPGKYVDRTALAILGVGDLDGGHPAEALEPARAGSEHEGVPLVQEAILLRPEAAQTSIEAQPECRRRSSAAWPFELDRAGLPPVGHNTDPDSGPGSEINLAPAATLPEHPDQSPKSSVVHNRDGRGDRLSDDCVAWLPRGPGARNCQIVPSARLTRGHMPVALASMGTDLMAVHDLRSQTSPQRDQGRPIRPKRRSMNDLARAKPARPGAKQARARARA